jgi:hypothetical protein
MECVYQERDSNNAHSFGHCIQEQAHSHRVMPALLIPEAARLSAHVYLSFTSPMYCSHAYVYGTRIIRDLLAVTCKQGYPRASACCAL